MTCYYAHCMALYGTPQEARDILTLKALRFGVIINPATDEIEARCKEVKAAAHAFNDRAIGVKVDPSQWVMDQIFKPLVQSASVLAFRALPDGRIPVGVLQEIMWAREVSNLIIELPSNLSGRGMTVDQTRDYLSEVGQR